MDVQEKLWKLNKYNIPIKYIGVNGDVGKLKELLLSTGDEFQKLKYIVFGDDIYSASETMSSFKANKSHSGDKNTENYYNIVEIYYFWLMKDTKYPIYMQECRSRGIKPIFITEKQRLLDFFESEDRNQWIEEMIKIPYTTKKLSLRDVCIEIWGSTDNLKILHEKLNAENLVHKNVEEEIEEVFFFSRPLYNKNEELKGKNDIDWGNIVENIKSMIKKMVKFDNKEDFIKRVVEKETLSFSGDIEDMRQINTRNFNDTNGSLVKEKIEKNLSDNLKIDLMIENNEAVSQDLVDQPEICNDEKNPFSTLKIKPIIIIPSSNDTIIHLGNVKEFLENGILHLIPKTRNPEHRIIIKRNLGKYAGLEYIVTDLPQKIKTNEWDYVVAIITDNKTWQFKGCMIKNPTTIFSKYPGFHFIWDERQSSKLNSMWNTYQLKLYRSHKNLGLEAQQLFWEKVDQWMTINHWVSRLLIQPEKIIKKKRKVQ